MKTDERDAMIEELWTMCAEILDRQEALAATLANRDKHYLTLGAHLERLLAKDREQMRALGLLKLVERANDVESVARTIDESQKQQAHALLRTIAASPLMKPKE